MDFVGKVSQVSHHPAHFGDDKRCNSGDITFLVVQEQDSTCALKSAILMFYFCRTRYVMLSHTIFQTVEMIIAMPCLYVRYLSHPPRAITPVQICYREREKLENDGNCKALSITRKCNKRFL